MRSGKATKERLRVEAIRLFAEKGIDGVATREITDAIGVRPGTLYVHWDSKEELVADLFVAGYAEYGRRLAEVAAGEAPLTARLAAMVRLICRLQTEDRDLFSFLLLSQHRALTGIAKNGDSNPVDVLQRAITAAMDAGEIPAREPALVTAGVVGVLVQAATFRLYGRLNQDLEPQADLIVELCLRVTGVPPQPADKPRKVTSATARGTNRRAR